MPVLLGQDWSYNVIEYSFHMFLLSNFHLPSGILGNKDGEMKSLGLVD